MLSNRLILIGNLAKEDHYYLDNNDECYYFGEYTPYVGYAHSKTNSLINNLKIPIDAPLIRQRHKSIAINSISSMLSQHIADNSSTMFVPIPPSKLKNNPLYDNRMLKILNGISKKIDIRDILTLNQEMEAFHLSENKRMPPDILTNKYNIEANKIPPSPSSIVLFDDVLTTGSHFKAAKLKLSAFYPGIKIVGVFVARVVREKKNTIDVSEFIKKLQLTASQ